MRCLRRVKYSNGLFSNVTQRSVRNPWLSLTMYLFGAQKFGRNEYNDFYHWTARYSFLEKLQAEGQEHYNIVFMDPDIYVVDDIQVL